MTYLSNNNLIVGTIVTEPHPQINKWLREKHKETRHLFDIWRIAKAVSKKLDKLCGVKGCEDVGLWKRAVKNHLYWSAVSTPDNHGETIQAKWLSFLYHIQDIHTEFPTPEVPACEHEELEEGREWLQPTTKAFTSLEKVTSEKKLLSDVSRMLSGEQTGALEAFNSLILQFAPKHTAFSWLGMRTRLRLAAMHYNENSGRGKSKTVTGEPRYQVYYSKAKQFEARVRPVVPKQTIDYATNLQGALLRMYKDSPSSLRHSIDSTKELQPASLSDKAMRVEKERAVENHLHRFLV